jgi:hypothetical protein
LKTPEATNNAFRTLDWVMEEGWPRIPRKQSKEDATKKANSSNIAIKKFRRKLFKLFL